MSETHGKVARGKLARTLVGLVGAAVFALGQSPAVADTGCSTRSTSAAFSFAGDNNQYFAAPNGGLDSTADWNLYGSSIVSGIGSPANLARSPYTRSGLVPGGSGLWSQWICVYGNEDTLRYFLSPRGSYPGNLTVSVAHTDPTVFGGWRKTSWQVSPSSPGTRYGATNWFYSPRVSIPWTPYSNGTQYIAVRFDTQPGTTGWYVDDLMIDPWRSN